MRKKKQNFIIPLVVYPFDVMVSVDESDEELQKTLNKYVYDPNGIGLIMNLPRTTQGRCIMLDCNQTIIRLKRQLHRHDTLANASHEIFHAVSFILQRIGMKMEVGVSDEAYAYLIAYLSKEIFSRI